MSTSLARLDAAAVDVEVTDNALRVVPAAGRELAAPLAWFPRLRDGTPAQRRHRRPIGPGHAVHWPDLDEDASVESLMRLS